MACSQTEGQGQPKEPPTVKKSQPQRAPPKQVSPKVGQPRPPVPVSEGCAGVLPLPVPPPPAPGLRGVWNTLPDPRSSVLLQPELPTVRESWFYPGQLVEYAGKALSRFQLGGTSSDADLHPGEVGAVLGVCRRTSDIRFLVQFRAHPRETSCKGEELQRASLMTSLTMLRGGKLAVDLAPVALALETTDTARAAPCKAEATTNTKAPTVPTAAANASAAHGHSTRAPAVRGGKLAVDLASPVALALESTDTALPAPCNAEATSNMKAPTVPTAAPNASAAQGPSTKAPAVRDSKLAVDLASPAALALETTDTARPGPCKAEATTKKKAPTVPTAAPNASAAQGPSTKAPAVPTSTTGETAPCKAKAPTEVGALSNKVSPAVSTEATVPAAASGARASVVPSDEVPTRPADLASAYKHTWEEAVVGFSAGCNRKGDRCAKVLNTLSGDPHHRLGAGVKLWAGRSHSACCPLQRLF